jgi:hypothetical protein
LDRQRDEYPALAVAQTRLAVRGLLDDDESATRAEDRHIGLTSMESFHGIITTSDGKVSPADFIVEDGVLDS